VIECPSALYGLGEDPKLAAKAAWTAAALRAAATALIGAGIGYAASKPPHKVRGAVIGAAVPSVVGVLVIAGLIYGAKAGMGT
jgi:hypothetical protein